MTENMIEIKQADRNNFCETSMDSFDRFQEVQNVWRIENGRFVLHFQPFTETGSLEQRRKRRERYCQADILPSAHLREMRLLVKSCCCRN